MGRWGNFQERALKFAKANQSTMVSYDGHPPTSASMFDFSCNGGSYTINGELMLHHITAWESNRPTAPSSNISDGSTASYYELPEGCEELQDLIAYRDMNAQIGEIFRACYRYGIVSHSDKLRDAKKMKFYAEAEIARLEKYESDN